MARRSTSKAGAPKAGRRPAFEAPAGATWRQAAGQFAASALIEEYAKADELQRRYATALDLLVRDVNHLVPFLAGDWQPNSNAELDPLWRQRSLAALSRLLISRSESARYEQRQNRPKPTIKKPKRFDRGDGATCANALGRVAKVLMDGDAGLPFRDRMRIANAVRPWLALAKRPPEFLTEAQREIWHRTAFDPTAVAKSLAAMAEELRKPMTPRKAPGPLISPETRLAAILSGIVRIATGAPWSLQGGGLLPKKGGRVNWKAIGAFVGAALEIDVDDKALEKRVLVLRWQPEMDW